MKTTLALLVAFVSFAQAQSGRVIQSNAAGWYTYLGDHPINDTWGVHIEGQVRMNHVITTWERILLREGVNYCVGRSLTLTAGYVYIRLFPTGQLSISVPEQRVYEQALIAQRSGQWLIKHRPRLEQVWKGTLSSGPNPVFKGYNYENRLRYEIRPQRPLTPHYYLQLAAEQQIRLGVNYKGRTLYQTRAYAAIGRRLSPHWSLETGYMLQYVVPQAGPGYQLNNVLRLTLLSDAPL